MGLRGQYLPLDQVEKGENTLPSQNERAASQILTEVLGGKVIWRDVPGAPPGTHDFELILDNGRTIAVEVTVSTDRRHVEFWRAVHDQSWQAPQLLRSWLLNVTPPARIKTLRGQIEPLLRSLEQAGVTGFGLGQSAKTPEIEQLHSLLVKGGGAIDSRPSCIYVSSTSAGAVSTEAVREAVEHEATKLDNRGKLGRASADEKHLFVWIDTLGTLAAVAMGFMDISPPTSCTLPSEIYAAWVVTPGQHGSGNIVGEHVWRCDPLNGWQKVR